MKPTQKQFSLNRAASKSNFLSVWYGGCEFVDIVEQLAIDRAKQLFGTEHANVQPHSGSGANMACYFAVLKPGDKMLTMDLSHGGHLTHGNKANFSGRFFEIVHYGVRKSVSVISISRSGKREERLGFSPRAWQTRGAFQPTRT